MKDENVYCPICGKKSVFFYKKFFFVYNKCIYCNHLFLNPFPSQDKLKKSYQVKSVSNNYTTFKKEFIQHVSFLNKMNRKGQSVLDVGCGDGEFLYLLKKKGYKGYGIDINKNKITFAKKRCLNVECKTLEELVLSNNKFDIIHLGDVIEHIINLNSFLKNISFLLKKDGIVILKTPNWNSFFPKITLFLSNIFGVPWSHVTPPEHVHQFSTKSLLFLLKNHNFNIIKQYFFPINFKYELIQTRVFNKFKNKKNISNLSKLLLILWLYFLAYLVDKVYFLKSRNTHQVIIFSK